MSLNEWNSERIIWKDLSPQVFPIRFPVVWDRILSPVFVSSCWRVLLADKKWVMFVFQICPRPARHRGNEPFCSYLGLAGQPTLQLALFTTGCRISSEPPDKLSCNDPPCPLKIFRKRCVQGSFFSDVSSVSNTLQQISPGTVLRFSKSSKVIMIHYESCCNLTSWLFVFGAIESLRPLSFAEPYDLLFLFRQRYFR